MELRGKREYIDLFSRFLFRPSSELEEEEETEPSGASSS